MIKSFDKSSKPSFQRNVLWSLVINYLIIEIFRNFSIYKNIERKYNFIKDEFM